MKKFLSLVLALVMTMSLVTVSAGASFKDDDKINYTEAVEVMKAIKVIDGYADGKFNPTNVLTRQAAAKIICNLILGPTTADALVATSAPYADVAADNQFAGYIAYCKQSGIISGYEDGLFRPTGTLTGYAFMKMLLGALGYDQTTEGYVGENWKVNVAKRALALGLDDDLIGAFNGNKSVNREEACLYALNMIQQNMVEYGQHGVATAKKTDTFMATYFKDLKVSKDIDRDAWGRPSVSHFKLKKEQIAYVALKPVAEYNVATSECDICKDLDEKKEAVMDATWTNGVIDKTDKKLTALATKAKVGAQGQIVEIYDIDDNYEMVIVDTYLAKVEKVTDAKFDNNGHLKKQATMELTVYTLNDKGEPVKTNNKDGVPATLKSDDNFGYKKGEYVLFHLNAEDEEDSEVIEAVEAQTMKYTGISNKSFSEIKLDGKWENFACKYAYDQDAIEDDFCKVDVFFDQFGNVIGTLIVEDAKTVAVIDAMYTETTKGKTVFLSDIVGTDAKMNEEKIDEIYNVTGDTKAKLTVDDILEKASRNEDKFEKAGIYDKLYTYTTDEDGVLTLNTVTDSSKGEKAYTDVSLKIRWVYSSGDDVKFNDDTVFLIHENDGSYTSVMGDEIGDIKADHVEYMAKSGYATVVYLYGNIFRAEDLTRAYFPVQDMTKMVNQKVDGETVKCMKMTYTTVDGEEDIAYLPVENFKSLAKVTDISSALGRVFQLNCGGFFADIAFVKGTKVVATSTLATNYGVFNVDDVTKNTVVFEKEAVYGPISLTKIDKIYVIEDGEITKGDASDVKEDTIAHVFFASKSSKQVVDELYIDLDLTKARDEALEDAKEAAVKALNDYADGLIEDNNAVTKEDLEKTLKAGIDAIEDAADDTAVKTALTAAKAALDTAVEKINEKAEQDAAGELKAEKNDAGDTIIVKNYTNDVTAEELTAVIAKDVNGKVVTVDISTKKVTVDGVTYTLTLNPPAGPAK